MKDAPLGAADDWITEVGLEFRNEKGEVLS
jgi:hypothetical protein